MTLGSLSRVDILCAVVCALSFFQRSLSDSEAAQRAASCSSLLSPLVAPEASPPPSDFFDEKKRKRRSTEEEDTSSGSDEDLLPKAALLQRAAAQARRAAHASDVSGDASPSVKKECYAQDETSPSPRSSSDPPDSVEAAQKDAEDVACRDSTDATQRGEKARFPERKRRRLIVAARDEETHGSACQHSKLGAPQVSLTVVAPDAVDRAAYPGRFPGTACNEKSLGLWSRFSQSDCCAPGSGVQRGIETRKRQRERTRWGRREVRLRPSKTLLDVELPP
ncbi:3'-5' exonuclease domain-containing protein [Toxoplasma gondii p89]|uniref:3'-5' exonuclease domain-containing protein n=1 Tax=Toxoplasma gondii p89 TaxID=943119 RepID=A0A086KUJ0_TOXGO|nr:3'-5' exonuclease domain-containing protein [Toxoplasma gondii p89]